MLYKSGEQFGVGSVVVITDDTYMVRKYSGPLNSACKTISNPAGDFINVQILKTSVVDDCIFISCLSTNKYQKASQSIDGIGKYQSLISLVNK